MTVVLVGCNGSGGQSANGGGAGADGQGGDGANGDGSGGAGPSSGGKPGTSGGDGTCSTDPDTSTVDAFFSTLACSWTLYAEDRTPEGTSDARFVHGAAYEVVLGADKTLTIESEDGSIVYEYGSGADSYADEDHEANVFLKPDGESIIVQYEKAAGTLQVVLSSVPLGEYNWSFASTEPPSALEAEDVGFMAGTWTSTLTYTYSASGTTQGELCDPIEVTIDEDGNAEVTLAGTTATFPFDKAQTFVGANGSSGASNIFRLERCAGPKDGFTCDVTELGLWWARPTGTTDAPILSKIQWTQDEAGSPSYYTAEESKVETVCP